MSEQAHHFSSAILERQGDGVPFLKACSEKLLPITSEGYQSRAYERHICSEPFGCSNKPTRDRAAQLSAGHRTARISTTTKTRDRSFHPPFLQTLQQLNSPALSSQPGSASAAQRARSPLVTSVTDTTVVIPTSAAKHVPAGFSKYLHKL